MISELNFPWANKLTELKAREREREAPGANQLNTTPNADPTPTRKPAAKERVLKMARAGGSGRKTR